MKDFAFSSVFNRVNDVANSQAAAQNRQPLVMA